MPCFYRSWGAFRRVKTPGKVLRYAFKPFVFSCHFFLLWTNTKDEMDWTSPVSPSDSRFCWWKVQEYAEWTADSMNSSFFCGGSLQIIDNILNPPFFGWDGLHLPEKFDPKMVVVGFELPEELEISSLGNLASSSRRFNLQLQAQEAWRQVCLVWGEFFPGGRVGGRQKLGTFHAWDFLATSIFWKEMRLEWWLLYQSFVTSFFFNWGTGEEVGKMHKEFYPFSWKMHTEDNTIMLFFWIWSLEALHRVGRLVVALVLPMSSSSEDCKWRWWMGLCCSCEVNNLDELYEWK